MINKNEWPYNLLYEMFSEVNEIDDATAIDRFLQCATAYIDFSNIKIIYNYFKEGKSLIESGKYFDGKNFQSLNEEVTKNIIKDTITKLLKYYFNLIKATCIDSYKFTNVDVKVFTNTTYEIDLLNISMSESTECFRNNIFTIKDLQDNINKLSIEVKNSLNEKLEKYYKTK